MKHRKSYRGNNDYESRRGGSRDRERLFAVMFVIKILVI